MRKYFIIILIFLGFSSYSYCNGGFEYVIKDGDSLWSILSDKYNLTNPQKLTEIIDLCLKMNPSIKNPDILSIGGGILIPENSEFGETAPVVPADTVDNKSLQNVLNEAKNKTPEEADKLFLDIQGYQLVKNSLLAMVFDRYELKIKADRLLIPRNITAENKQEYLINYITSPSEETSTNLKNLLKEKNYILIEIVVK
ncbi:MAG: LysM domain-containing protein [bacterium]